MAYTLKYLLENYKVMIPLIQRDYAQGRDTELELRKGFVHKINQSLQSGQPTLNLDFIYGYIKQANTEEHIFIPLDGQQRLTTLWLLHWFLAPRKNQKLTSDTIAYLSRFTYETRLSSKRFCQQLINQPLEIVEETALSDQITDAPWFIASWSNDPTVSSMLNMLDSLQTDITDKRNAWLSLINKNKVTFDFIDIKSDEFKLTDDLYIKMNSRGKPLTQFENFKAQFSDLLASSNTDYFNSVRKYENTNLSYQQYFAFNIDSKWMDLFWSYRDKTDNGIDESIYLFINYIAEFLFFKDNPPAGSDVNNDFNFLNTVFSKKKNIDFLIDSLNFLSSLNDINTFFEDVFIETSTFDLYSKDYFYRAITDTGFEVKDKITLYVILSYCINSTIQNADEKLRDLVRIIRNLLLAVRQPSQSNRIEYTSNLRLPNLSEYCKFIDSFIKEIRTQNKKSVYQILSEKEFNGFTKELISNEKAKAAIITQNFNLKTSIHRLEEHTQLQGNITNFKLTSNNLQRKINAFLAIWDKNTPDSLIIRSFLASDDYSIMTHDYSSLGEIWFFGCKNKWNRILTSADKNDRNKVSSSLDKFLIEFNNAKGTSTIQKLQFLIDNFQPSKKDWRYYFVKYKIFTDNPYKDLNAYTWRDKKGFDINHLGNSGNLPLHSYHLNPYLIALEQSFDENKKLKLIWGRFAEISYLSLDEKINISCKSDGWLISTNKNYLIDKKIVAKFKLNQQAHEYWLTETENKDRIEIGVDFINSVLK